MLPMPKNDGAKKKTRRKPRLRLVDKNTFDAILNTAGQELWTAEEFLLALQNFYSYLIADLSRSRTTPGVCLRALKLYYELRFGKHPLIKEEPKEMPRPGIIYQVIENADEARKKAANCPNTSSDSSLYS